MTLTAGKPVAIAVEHSKSIMESRITIRDVLGVTVRK